MFHEIRLDFARHFARKVEICYIFYRVKKLSGPIAVPGESGTKLLRKIFLEVTMFDHTRFASASVCLAPLAFIAVAVASAQQASPIGFGSGQGSLSWTVTTTPCGEYGSTTQWQFTNFVYTNGYGTRVPLSGSANYFSGSGGSGCPLGPEPLEVPLTPVSSSGVQFNIAFSPAANGEGYAFRPSPPTWNTVMPNHYELYGNKPAGQPSLPASGSLFGQSQYWELLMPGASLSSSVTTDVFGCKFNNSYDTPPTWATDANGVFSPLSDTELIGRAYIGGNGSDYQMASAPVSGSGIASRGFSIWGGYSTTTAAPAQYTCSTCGSLNGGLYFDTNICGTGGSEFGFGHNYYEAADYFYYWLVDDQCFGAGGAAVSCYYNGTLITGGQVNGTAFTLPHNHSDYYDFYWEAWIEQAPSYLCPSGVSCYAFGAQVLDPTSSPALQPVWGPFYYVPAGQTSGSAVLTAMSNLDGGGSGSLGAVRVSINYEPAPLPSPPNPPNDYPTISWPNPAPLGFAFVQTSIGH
jgi:hypothetical protein